MAPPETSTPAPDPRSPAPLSRWHALRVVWHLLLPALWMLLLVLAMAATIGGGAVWLLHSEAGTAWLLSRLPGVEARGLQGALISNRFSAQRLALRWDGGRMGVAIDGFSAEGMVWAWRPEPGVWASLDATRLYARQVSIDTGPRSPRPLPLPGTLQPPIRVAVQEARVDELRVDTLAPFRKLAARGVFPAGSLAS